METKTRLTILTWITAIIIAVGGIAVSCNDSAKASDEETAASVEAVDSTTTAAGSEIVEQPQQ